MARVYVADDNPDVRHVVVYSLMDQGHDVTTLRDGESALEAILAEPPDLLILDMMMPGHDGYEILAQMRGRGVQDITRTIVLTARASGHDRSRALGAGADVFLNKPFDPEILASSVDELLELSLSELRARRARIASATPAAHDVPVAARPVETAGVEKVSE
jgi:DNA-binding response OmpR family regulator